MTRYETLQPGYDPFDVFYAHNERGEVLPRPATSGNVKKVLDRLCVRERSIERFARWVNNRE